MTCARRKKIRLRIGLREAGTTLLVALSLALCLPFAGDPARASQGRGPDADAAGFINIALPASNEIRVENQRGGVRVEVWDESTAALAFTGGGEQQPAAKGRRRAPARSPVRIDKSESLVSVVVPRTATARQSPVELQLRLPRHARARIFTSGGAIEVSGVTAQLSAQTVSGDIRLNVSRDADADITAHSLNGSVTFEGGEGTPPSARQFDRAKFQTRLGAGGNVARLFSGRGQIHVAAMADGADKKSSARIKAEGERPGGGERKAPGLVGMDDVVRTPAGTPDANPSGAPQEIDEDEVIRVDSELATVNVSVVDRARGRGLTGLTQGDFKLFEDNVEQQVEHFEAANAPFDLVLLIDLSGSTGKVTDLIRAAATRFVDAARTQDRIAVITFASDVKVASPLTTDRAALRAAVRTMEPPVGHTRLYDAANSALDFLDRGASEKRRRAVVLMSDGLDSTLPNVTGTGSGISYDDLRSRVQEFEGLFYTIWTSTEYEAFSPEDIQPETFDLVHDRMKELAETGGGVFYDVENLEDLAGAYERVVEDLGTVYSLSYRPTNKARDGRWRAIRVRLPRHPQAVARGKRGYFAN